LLSGALVKKEHTTRTASAEVVLRSFAFRFASLKE
jgi:hypothetical protein